LKIIKAWIQQEIEFENRSELEAYKGKRTAINAVIISEAEDSASGKITIVVKKPYNNCEM
jgi:hypothetical protein